MATGALHVLCFAEEIGLQGRWKAPWKSWHCLRWESISRKILPYFFLSISRLLGRVLSPCKSVLSDVRTHRGSCCCSRKFSSSFVPYSFLYISFGIPPEEVKSWFSVVSGAAEVMANREGCTAVRGCAGLLERGRSDLSEQQLRGLSQHVRDSSSLCSLLAQCSFWSWKQKPSPATSICSFCVERRTEGEKGVTSVVYFQVILRNIFRVFLTGADSNWNGEGSKMPIIFYLMLVLCDSSVGHGKSFYIFFFPITNCDTVIT